MKPFDIAAEDTQRAYPFDMLGMTFTLVCANEITRCLWFSVRRPGGDVGMYVYELSLQTSPRGLGGKQFEHFEKRAVLYPPSQHTPGMEVTLEESQLPDFEGFDFKGLVTGETVVRVGTYFDIGLNKFAVRFEIFPEVIPSSLGVGIELDCENCLL